MLATAVYWLRCAVQHPTILWALNGLVGRGWRTFGLTTAPQPRAFYRRLAYRVGKAKAITATARKLAILVYHTLKGELVYQDPGAAEYDARDRARVLRRLRQRAEHLGFTLVNLTTGEVVEGAVS